MPHGAYFARRTGKMWGDQTKRVDADDPKYQLLPNNEQRCRLECARIPMDTVRLVGWSSAMAELGDDESSLDLQQAVCLLEGNDATGPPGPTIGGLWRLNGNERRLLAEMIANPTFHARGRDLGTAAYSTNPGPVLAEESGTLAGLAGPAAAM